MVGLGNNNGGGGNNLTWAGLRCIQAEAVQGPGVSLVPSLDLAEPGRRLSRHKAEVASRLVSMAAWPRPPAMQKACFVYIYIALRLTEAVLETPGYKDHGFSSCCVTQDMAKVELQQLYSWRMETVPCVPVTRGTSRAETRGPMAMSASSPPPRTATCLPRSAPPTRASQVRQGGGRLTND